MTTTYGILQDIHENPGVVGPALEALIHEGAEALILNGDIGGWKGNLQDSCLFMDHIVRKAVETGLPVYAQPGSHEPFIVFDSVMKTVGKEHENLVSITQPCVKKFDDHTLSFLPGSDINVEGGGYKIISDPNVQTGIYFKTPQGLKQAGSQEEFDHVIKTAPLAITQLINMNDLHRAVPDPDYLTTTVVFSSW